MAFLIDIEEKTTPRDLLKKLEQSFSGKMDKPIGIEMIHKDCGNCDPLDAVQMKIVDQGDRVELRVIGV